MQIKLGVILRCFARSDDQITKQVEEVSQAIGMIGSLFPSAYFSLLRMDVVIPTDPRFIDVDCGQTHAAFESQSRSMRWQTVCVSTRKLDLFSGLVNEAAARQLSFGCTHSLVFSSTCVDLISNANVEAMTRPFSDGARATGLILPDPTLGEFIRRGCITNTFAIWDLVAFFAVGGLDLALRNRYKDDRFNTYVRGAKDEAIPITGLEIPTVARLIDSYGPCVAPVVPVTAGEWKKPNDEEGRRREDAKMRSKATRHLAIAALYGFDLSFIEAGILPGYPK